MLNSKTLNEVLKDPKKVLFHSKTKISLNFCDIETIDDVPKLYHKIEKLHISHNRISKLTGIQQFKHITHLALSYNQLKDWKELLKIVNKEALVELNIKGNPFTAHPNHLFLIMERFPNLQRIDDLKISKEDRYYLTNYWQLSGKILPFFIKFKEDLAIVEQAFQRMKLTVEIRGRDKDMSREERKENMQKLEELYYKMMEDLKNDQFFIHIHRILEKYGKFQSQSPTLTLKIIDSIIQGLYENSFELSVFDRKALFVNYKKLFNDLMLRYFSIHDTSFDRFLSQKVLETQSYDHWKFSEDNEYAFDCVMYEFYKLMPNQASISHNINFSFGENEQEDNQIGWENPRNKVVTSLDIGPSDPEFLRNVCITHFPLFPLNLQYNNNILKMIISQLEIVENMAIDIYMFLDSNSPIIKSLGNYRLFLETKMQAGRARSQTPPNYRENTDQLAEDNGEHHFKRLATSVPSRRGEGEYSVPGSPGIGSPGSKSSKNYYLIPKSTREDNALTSMSRTGVPSPTRYQTQMNSNGDRDVLGLGLVSSGRLDTKDIQTDRDYQFAGKRKNVLPLLIIMKIDTNQKMQLKEGFNNIKQYVRSQKKAQRKAIVEEFYQNIREKLDINIKTRVMRSWHQRAETRKNLLSCFREIRYRRLAKYFNLLNVACEKSRNETKFYYMKNLSLKVFYSILSLRMKKRASLKRVLDKYIQKRSRIINLYLSKWRLMNSAMKYALRKAGVNKSLGHLMTIKKGQGSNDTRKYKELKDETMRLQTKKTIRELEPYFTNDRDIFRKCSACDYDLSKIL